jgi:hypothetical protein
MLRNSVSNVGYRNVPIERITIIVVIVSRTILIEFVDVLPLCIDCINFLFFYFSRILLFQF